ncbi:MAG: DNA polymerase I [Gammaproteobacteria bacterium]|nr:DNA polymerase I [Gammaproteobacteria bacterium]
MAESADSPALILVDGSSYLFRAFHALPPMTTGRGQPTGAVRGVISMIRNLLNKYPGSRAGIVFDAKGKTFRNDIYVEYKAHRPPMPDELRSQIEPIHRIIRAMGLPLLIVENVEADDVIGTLARQADAANVSTLISTGDKDLAQLVTGQVTLINTMNDELLDPPGVEAKFGVPPERIIDLLALMGDKSDNIPGVPGVGAKTAEKWLKEYGSMRAIIENADAIKGKIGEKLRDNIEQLELSYLLATIRTDVPLELGYGQLERKDEDKQELHRIFSELEFRTWLRELEAEGVTVPPAGDACVAPTPATAAGATRASPADDEPPPATTVGARHASPGDDEPPPGTESTVVTSEAQLRDLLAELRAAPRFSFNLEVEPGHFLDVRVVGIAFCARAGKAAYIPLNHDYEACPELLSAEQVFAAVKPLLEDALKPKCGYDLKHQMHFLQNLDIELRPVKSDVLLASYVVNSVAVRHQLDAIGRRYLESAPKDLESLTGKGRGRLEMHQLGIEEFGAWAAERADTILRLTGVLERHLRDNGHLEGLYRYFEMPLVSVLQRMERKGIKLDSGALGRQSAELAERLEEIEQSAFALAGESFNLSSPKQLQALLYDKLKLPVLRKTPTGQPSTAEDVLHELAENYELPQLLLRHRSLTKLKSTYTDKLPEELHPETGRIHSNFQQAVAATGRLSSTDPNLQNIPVRTAEGRRVRQAFVCEPGYKLVAADYSQVELRIMAHLSGDKGLLEAFSRAEDIHRATAAEVFGVPLEEVDPEQRRSAKAINFGLIYGMSAFGLGRQLNIGRAEAQQYVDRYFERYPGVRAFMDRTQGQATDLGYVETVFGRRLYLPDLHAGRGVLRRAALRTAINAPMQGTAADIIKQAMIDIDMWLESEPIDARMLLQVHDELVFEVNENDLQLLCDGVRFRMISAAALDVPLVVDVGIGDNWDEAH